MDTVFMKLLNMSISASWMILAVTTARLLLRKAPKNLTLLLWGLVGLRLICPVSLKCGLSLLPSGEVLPRQFLYTAEPAIHSGIPAVNTRINPVLEDVLAPQPGASINPAQMLLFAGAVVWLLGIAVMLVHTIVGVLRLRRQTAESASLLPGVMFCDRIPTPFVFGLFSPVIYLPSGLRRQDFPYVLAHEKAHLQRRDYIWKPLGYLILMLHWFNPLVWFAYKLFARDLELACDAKVLSSLGPGARKPYSSALLSCGTGRTLVSACPLAFGEGDVKQRIKAALSYRKPRVWLIVLAVLVCLGVAICFFTVPAGTALYVPQGDSPVVRIVVEAGTRRCQLTEPADMTPVLSFLSEIKTGKAPLSLDRSEDRSWTQRITLYDQGNRALRFCFQESNGSVWVEDGVKPGLCLPVTDPEVLEHFFAILPMTALEQTNAQYFGLDSREGLTVYVWQMAANSYSCVLCSGQPEEYTLDLFGKLLPLQPLSMSVMRQIVDSYGLPQDQISIRGIYMPHSSYLYSVDEAYQKQVQRMFWSS